jgi:hypothetical protein
MKRRQFIALTLFTVSSVVFYGCFKRGPGKTVELFYRSLEKGDIDNAMGVFSSSTTNNFPRNKIQLYMNEAVKETQEKQGIKSFKIDREDITGDTAKVSYTVEYGNGTIENETLELIKENGEWKINPTGK